MFASEHAVNVAVGDVARLHQRGFTYYAIGRGDSLATGLHKEQRQ